MNASYEVMKTAEGEALTSTNSADRLAKVDAIVFDCDGTLIDVRKSYDVTVIKTAASMTREFFGRSLPIGQVGKEFILQIRRTGGFNSDWDTTYAITLFCAAAIDETPAGEEEAATNRLAEIVKDFASSERLDGWKSVDRYVGSNLESETLRKVRAFLGYPGNPHSSRMTAEFDREYYGGRLYERIYGLKAGAGDKEGLIDREEVIVTERSLSALVERLGAGRIAMATGRPFVAVQHTLGKLLGYFDKGASVFIGDGDISPEEALKLSKFKKPSGESLVLARKALSSKVLLYVGDSAEDRLMVHNANAPRGSILFAGIYGTAFNEKEQKSYFVGGGSDLILKSVNQVPEVLGRCGA